ncbi:MAG: NAD(P)H-hydrate dehydratase [Bacteroidaceae bacterium]|nr:NAD(P)H-hydrate dehydratase [Bacteroidaceae bacterium]
MKILTNIQIKELDRLTIEEEGIQSIELMERAALALSKTIGELFKDVPSIKIFAGPGNNGGDALAIARILSEQGYSIEAYLFNTTGHLSEDCAINRDRLSETSVQFTEITTQFIPPVLLKSDLVIDGLFGSGLNKPLNGGFAAVVNYINSSPATVISIDMPSGLMCEDNTFNQYSNVIKANITLTLQIPKLAFFLAENQPYIGEWMCLDIQLSETGIAESNTPYHVIQKENIRPLMQQRKEFAHKGEFGHGLLIAGKYGMAGAAVLSARACLRSGIGLLTVHTPSCNNIILQTAVPEAIVHPDTNEHLFSTPIECDNFQAIAIGPGLGQSTDTVKAFFEQLHRFSSPIIVDADALNILSSYKGYLSSIPANSILTPHPKELERLVGHCTSDYERLSKARTLATEYHLYIILKGAWSTIISPNGQCHFNPTGNPGMATAGSGDVLTGVLLALLAQGYTPYNTCLLGVYLHGIAGDLAAEAKGKNGIIASDIIEHLPLAWKLLIENKYFCNYKESRCI